MRTYFAKNKGKVNVILKFLPKPEGEHAMLNLALALILTHTANASCPGGIPLAQQVNCLRRENAAQEIVNQDLQLQIDDQESRLEALEDLLAPVTRTGDTLVFSGVNVQIVNGSGDTYTANGTGNLIVGYNADNYGYGGWRTGSHNLALGDDNWYSGNASIVSGSRNGVAVDDTAVIGGYTNNTWGQYSVILGGYGNIAYGTASAIFGGILNQTTTTAEGSVVVGGAIGQNDVPFTTVVGGELNL